MIFRQLFENASSTYTYLIASEKTREAVLIDPVLEDVDKVMKLLDGLDLQLVYTFETHVHADHVTAGGTLREKLGSKTVVRRVSGPPCADVHVDHGDVLEVGDLRFEVRATPGHTDGCVAYVMADRVFTGDTLLIGGCGRTDFQQGDAGKLYDSVHTQLFSLPAETLVFPGHDYRGRTVSTIGEEKATNARLGGGRSREDFIQLMAELKLDKPKQIERAVPANLACGLDQQGRTSVDAEAHDAAMFAEALRKARLLPGGYREVSPEGAMAHLESFRIVDVRQPDEYTSPELGRIAAAVNIPLATVGRAMAEWPKDVPLLMVCRSGRRSAAAAEELAQKGFQELYNLVGGMIAWNDFKLPVKRGG
jgi:glyoxylase-like metal-dependent hydrolase (beta-lactamase superfamily II)/rhodanese-related sulfurtransferase